MATTHYLMNKRIWIIFIIIVIQLFGGLIGIRLRECKVECVKRDSSTDRCFYLCNEGKSWEEAHESCTVEGAVLTTDNNDQVHELISSLTGSSQQVWIGGHTQPKYWNWMYTDNGSTSSAKIYFQGCFANKAGTIEIPAKPVTGGFDLEDCNRACLIYNATYYSLSVNNQDYLCRCILDKYVSSDEVGSLRTDCLLKQNLYLGSHKWNALYATNRPINRRWVSGHPTGLDGTGGSCMNVVRPDEIYKWQTSPCTLSNQLQFLCAREADNGCNNFEDRSGDHCLIKSTASSLVAAFQYCTQRGSWLLSLSSNELLKQFTNNFPVHMWIAATSLRWSWRDNGEEVSDKWWAENSHFAFEGWCLSLKQSKWHGVPCEEPLKFICQKDIKRTVTTVRTTLSSSNVTRNQRKITSKRPNSTKLPNSSTPDKSTIYNSTKRPNIGKNKQTTTIINKRNEFNSVSNLVMFSTTPVAVAPSTESKGSVGEVSNFTRANHIPLYLGLAVGGFFLLLTIAVLLALLGYRHRNAQKSKEEVGVTTSSAARTHGSEMGLQEDVYAGANPGCSQSHTDPAAAESSNFDTMKPEEVAAEDDIIYKQFISEHDQIKSGSQGQVN